MIPFIQQFRPFKIRIGIWIALLVATLQLAAARQTLAQTRKYIVIDLPGAADGGRVPFGLNNMGDLVGRAGISVPAESRATIWNRSSLEMKNLGVLAGGEYSSGSGINDAKEVAGSSNTRTSIVPFLWTPIGGTQRVPLLPGDNCGQAFAINKYGHVVGYSSGRNGARAFLWVRKGGARNLGTLPGGNHSRARDINDSDEIVGTSASAAGDRAVLWTKSGSVKDLGTLPGDTSSEAIAINNAGDVVGYSKGPQNMHAFLWTKTTGMQDLGVLPGGNSSRSLDINDAGDVVGSSTSSLGDHAFIWTKQGGMEDLNNADSLGLSVVFMAAHAINYNGEILVTGKVTHESSMSEEIGSPEGQLCTPAPPSSFLLKPASLE